MSIRLLHCRTLRFEVFHEARAPRYAILSHTWNAPEEVTLQDMVQSTATKKAGYNKITGSCRLALSHRIDYVWIDTCCIDKANSAETAEAIRSMFRWYENAAVCYVYLSDLRSPDTDALRKCYWFTRGWTLQELLAPRNVEFYDSAWRPIGSKAQLASRLSEITLIPVSAILGQDPLGHYSVAQRMSWASKRVTTRIEDTAYCLFGIFDAYVLPIYGEGEKAFQRLQEEIVKRHLDLTTFAWLPAASRPGTASVQTPSAYHDILTVYSRLFASSPAYFKLSYQTIRFSHFDSDFEVSNRGLRITTSLVLLPFSPTDSLSSTSGSKGTKPKDVGDQRYRYVLPLGFSKSTDSYVGIWLKKIGSDSYLRESISSLAQIPESIFGAVRKTENHTCYIILSPNTALSAAAGTPRSFPPMASHASRTSLFNPATATGGHVSAPAKSILHTVYNPRLYPGGIYVPNFSSRGIYFNSFSPRLWDERTRICCQPESPNDVVAFSCTGQQGPDRQNKLSFGVLLDFRDSRGPRCVVVSMSSPETRGVFVLSMRQEAQPMRWQMVENELSAVTRCTNVLQATTETGRKYAIAASIVTGNVKIDEHFVPMSTLDIKITSMASTPAPTLRKRKYQ